VLHRVLAAAALAACVCAAHAQPLPVVRTELYGVRPVIVATGLAHPWSIAWLPDGRALITEREGRLRLLGRDGRLDPDPVAGLPRNIAAMGQGGLFDALPHPRFADNGWVYIAYAGRGDGGVGTELARGRLAGNRFEAVEVLFRQTPKGSGGRHFGGKIVFDPAGFVYLTLGDRGDQDRAQRPGDHAGSVIRLHDDGRVPQDNPFVGRPGFLPEKYTLGNRNIQGAAFDARTGLFWTHEHGPQGGDEVNVIRPGVNYGWPVITYGVNYGIGTRIGEGTAKPGMAQPVHYWVPSIAPSGLAIYAGERFPRWRGDLLVGALRGEVLVRLRLDGEKVVHEERMLRGTLGRIRDVRVGPDGFVYVLTDAADGAVVRLEAADQP
jgi:glucose/arabinose dehydrogenase